MVTNHFNSSFFHISCCVNKKVSRFTFSKNKISCIFCMNKKGFCYKIELRMNEPWADFERKSLSYGWGTDRSLSLQHNDQPLKNQGSGRVIWVFPSPAATFWQSGWSNKPNLCDLCLPKKWIVFSVHQVFWWYEGGPPTSNLGMVLYPNSGLHYFIRCCWSNLTKLVSHDDAFRSWDLFAVGCFITLRPPKNSGGWKKS